MDRRTAVQLACGSWLSVCLACEDTSASGGDAASPVLDARAPVLDASPTPDAGAPHDAAGPSDAADERDGTSAARDADAVCSDCCADGFPLGSAGDAGLVAHFTPSPEGVTVCPSGDVIVALDGSGELWRVPAAGGEPTRWGSVGERQPAGVSCDAEGRVFVAIYSVRGASLTKTPSLALVAHADADAEILPAPTGGSALQGLNGVVAVPGVGVYASDTGSSQLVLWREDDQHAFTGEVVARDVNMPNGLAYSAKERTLYVATSLDQRVLAFPVAADGALGKSSELLRGADLLGFFDGVAIDDDGTPYVASHLAGSVLQEARVIARVTNPASLAFRGSTLFITDYKVGDAKAEGGLYAVDVGVCGAAR